MGTMQHKYTREYFTGRLQDGSPAGYGAEGYYSYLDGSIREQDLNILKRINFENRHILEFGFGRGESIKYMLEHGAQYYEGVDFAPAAHQLAREYLQKHGLSIPNLHQEDALVFIRNIENDVVKKKQKYDLVIMLDFIEHVERNELREIIKHVRNILDDNGVLVINTPAFLHDNDVAAHGVNFDNRDGADLIDETSGMHCNKYTLGSLHTFLDECGFYALSEAHFFALKQGDSNFFLESFRTAWEEVQARGGPLLEYGDDQIESPPDAPYSVPPVHTFDEGSLLGMSLYISDFYLQFFKKGTHDDEVLQVIHSLPEKPKVIFDVGGFMGVSSLLFSRLLAPEGQVYCFEPNIMNIIRIQKNLSLNPEEAQHISIVPGALGKDDGEACMLMSDEVDTGYSSTSQIKAAHGTLPQSHLVSLNFFEQNIRMQRLDTFVANTGIIPDMIKVDIEGAEHWLLEGGVQTLREHRPIVFIELHSPFCALKCSYLLEQAGYTTHVLHEEEDKRLMVLCVSMNNPVLSAESLEQHTSKGQQKKLTFILDRNKRIIDIQRAKIKKLSHSYEKLKRDDGQMCQECERLRQDFTRMQQEIEQLRKNHERTQAELANTQRILSHPVICAQRKLWQVAKKALIKCSL